MPVRHKLRWLRNYSPLSFPLSGWGLHGQNWRSHSHENGQQKTKDPLQWRWSQLSNSSVNYFYSSWHFFSSSFSESLPWIHTNCCELVENLDRIIRFIQMSHAHAPAWALASVWTLESGWWNGRTEEDNHVKWLDWHLSWKSGWMTLTDQLTESFLWSFPRMSLFKPTWIYRWVCWFFKEELQVLNWCMQSILMFQL